MYIYIYICVCVYIYIYIYIYICILDPLRRRWRLRRRPQRTRCRANTRAAVSDTQVKSSGHSMQRQDRMRGREHDNSNLRDPGPLQADMLQSIGWHYLSNATCLIRPHFFYVLFIVPRITMICYILSPLLKKASVRQVALDKWFPLNRARHTLLHGSSPSFPKLHTCGCGQKPPHLDRHRLHGYPVLLGNMTLRTSQF